MSSFVRACRSALFATFAVLAIAAPAQQTRYVPSAYPTIQSAIDAASSGDTVSVSAGIYYENLVIDTKHVTLLAPSTASQTTIDGRGLGPVVTISNTVGDLTVITGFTLQNGGPSPSASSPSPSPTGVVIVNGGAFLSGNDFSNNPGGSIAVLNGSATIRGNAVDTATTAGGACSGNNSIAAPGIYVSGASTFLNSLGLIQPTLIVGNIIYGDGTRCSGTGVQIDHFAQPLTLQNNTIRNNGFGVSGQGTQLLFIQNLIYDNVSGGLALNSTPTSPDVDPPTTLLFNNTIVNNLTSPAVSPSGSPIADVYLDGTVARTEFINNILVGTTSHPVLACATASPSVNDTPLILDHNDLYNTTQTPGALISGDCTSSLGTDPLSQIGVNGNLSVDPHLAGSTDLHPLAGSPVLDAGNNSAPSHLAQDLDGNARFGDVTGRGYPVIDLGVYERSGTVTAPQTTTNLTSSTYYTPGGAVTLTATVVASDGTSPATTVTFLENGTPVGTASTDPTGVASLPVSLTAYGVYALTATAAPAAGYAPSASPVLYVDVTSAATPATTTLSLTASNAAPYLNQGFTLTAHIGSTITNAGVSQPGPVPPGAVALYDGTTFLSNLQPDASGLATYTISGASAGQHAYSVVYAGTVVYTPATAYLNVGVLTPSSTATTATITPSPAALGQTVTLAATVANTATSSVPTGSVTFTDGATVLGTVPLSSGAASLTTSSLTVGLHTITFTYTPDPAFSQSSTTRSVTVGGIATQTSIVSSSNPAFPGNTVLFTVTVANADGAAHTGPPAGSVSLTDGSTLIANGVLAPATASGSIVTLSASFTTIGDHPLTATYLPATNSDVASSGTLTETITALPVVTTVLSANPNPVTVGQPVTLSASVTSPSALATPITVTFLDNSTVLGTVTLPSAGPATLTLSTLSLGTHPLSATVHTADSSSVRSTSNGVPLQVVGLASSLALTASPQPNAFATAPVTLSATLTTSSAPASSPTGTVTFFDGSAVLGTAPLGANGQTTLTTSSLSTGGHTLTATYSGDSLIAASTSAGLSELIQANPTATTLAVSPATTTAFQVLTLTAHVSSSTTMTSTGTPVCNPACAPPTVTFYAAGTTPSPIATAVVDASGNAIAHITPAAGMPTFTASFSGDALFAPSASATATATVALAPATLSLAASPNPVSLNSTSTLTATISAPSSAATHPSGSITFLEGSTSLGTASLSGSATFAYAGATPGVHTLTATYSGDANYTPASATITLTVLTPPVLDFSLATSQPSITMRTEHHGSLNISITPIGSFSDIVHLSCGNLPAFVSCTFAAADPVVGDAGSSAATTTSLAVDTDFLLDWAYQPRIQTPGTPPRSGRLPAILALSLPFTLLAGLTLRRARPGSSGRAGGHPRVPNLFLLLLVAAATLSLSACSGRQPGHTPPGTYTLTIIGHGKETGIERSTTLTLVVTP